MVLSCPTTLRRWLILVFVALSYLLAACGGDSILAGAAGTQGPASASATSTSVDLMRGTVRPSATSTQQPKAATAPPAGVTRVPSQAPSPDPSGQMVQHQGIPVGFTDDGHPYLGNRDAPVTIEEYTDYLCPFCSRHVIETVPGLLEGYVASGQVQYVFYDMPLVSLHPTAPKGHSAALCVAEQGADLYWAMHDELFRVQKEWSRLPDPGDFLAGVAAKVGADKAAYAACIASGRQDQRVQEGISAGQALGFSGTPSFRFVRRSDGESYKLVGAQPLATFRAWLDAVLAGKAPPQEQESSPEPRELPLWATAKGLAPDPKRPGFTVAGDAFKGDPTANVVVVEFADFQCPPCRAHALDTQPVLDKTFVDSGEILWVFKHLPLQIHPQAPASAAASECAADQGSFWEMHDLLFEAQSQWSVDDPEPVLLDLAKQLGLDLEQFGTCLASEETRAKVQADLSDAQGVVNSTPSFVILFGGQGGILNGSRPAEQFVSILQDVLKSAEAGRPPDAQ